MGLPVSIGLAARRAFQLLSSSGGNPGSILESILVTSQVFDASALVTAMSTTFPGLQGADTYFLAVDVRPQLTTSGRWGLSTFSGDPRGPDAGPLDDFAPRARHVTERGDD